MSQRLTIVTKTLYERRVSTLLWFLAIVLFVLLTMLLFPSLKDALGESLKEAPKSLEKLLGSAQDYQTLTGYIDLQVINQMIFMTIIMGVLTGTALIAGEENNGTLHTQLARPITRFNLYWQKFLAMAVLTFIVSSLGILSGIAIGTIFLGETIEITRVLQAGILTWLLTFFFATMAFSIGAATGRRGVAGVITGMYAFVAYMLTALSQLAESLEKLNYASIYHYFNTPSVIKYGFDYGNITVIAIGIIIFSTVGYVLFSSRDLTNR